LPARIEGEKPRESNNAKAQDLKASTNIATQFAIAGAFTTAQTGIVTASLTIKRYGNSGITDNDSSSTNDYVTERTGFIMGIR